MEQLVLSVPLDQRVVRELLVLLELKDRQELGPDGPTGPQGPAGSDGSSGRPAPWVLQDHQDLQARQDCRDQLALQDLKV